MILNSLDMTIEIKNKNEASADTCNVHHHTPLANHDDVPQSISADKNDKNDTSKAQVLRTKAFKEN